MLVLTRKSGESLMLGEDIEITVVEVRKDGVKLGIDAPRDVPIWRKELFDEIAQANVSATQPQLAKSELDKLFTQQHQQQEPKDKVKERTRKEENTHGA
ncbi:MAG: carbon storage regulator CsrA [Synergistales bacterium]|nr:carbon storage regulator CsrA [Synergistales bacterium]